MELQVVSGENVKDVTVNARIIIGEKTIFGVSSQTRRKIANSAIGMATARLQETNVSQSLRIARPDVSLGPGGLTLHRRGGCPFP